MPLSKADQQFLRTASRFKVYVLLIGVGILVFLVLSPPNEMRLTTAVIGLALAGTFWLSQRLLTYVASLNRELARLVHELKDKLPEKEYEKLHAAKR